MTEYEKACLGKVRFLSRSLARRRARQIRRIGGDRLRPYQCQFCGLHHLGHLPGQATHLRLGRPLKELIQ
ncbi:hypothetical protein F3K34_43845 [Streptomyces sp. LBUM 1486]|uniref:hypothetical protein n=1 Tax=Streptomyces scabiei TaxID=1930 RepID=UPI001B32931C|nr:MULTISPECIES: hypothetical protein [Streptomyces]MBP5918721.1 hypothetical protein [Streptomyces sp. LBUM 1486]MDX2800151.1 hypothetical protein [Streptomyces scabiei]MDX3127069.1 hypothetical protein [Streptomyces scabiei]MDX3283603.1 hypothetical protein [Streptomyces scabiei]MDX3283606.1 hypothetical protein [Streptomyces scabiei]